MTTTETVVRKYFERYTVLNERVEDVEVTLTFDEALLLCGQAVLEARKAQICGQTVREAKKV